MLQRFSGPSHYKYVLLLLLLLLFIIIIIITFLLFGCDDPAYDPVPHSKIILS